ncbi:MAG: aldolase, partial [Proteobacteria bacterium]|nr:aldolase [Pseudomonadota bacterium]
KLALACRILARDGHVSGLAGQLTMRAAEGGWWTLPLGLGFDEGTAGAMIRVDEDLRLLEGEGMANPAVRFHVWVYRARPEVNAVVHTHPPFCNALSLLGTPLVVAHMDCAMLYEDCAYLSEWPGVPVADDEGALIAGALGGKRTLLLAHHGQLAAATSIEEATYLSFHLERAARMQLRAAAAGTIKPVVPEHARGAHDFLLRREIVEASFHHMARAELRADAALLR